MARGSGGTSLLIGRDRELEQIALRLRRARLVTLTGVGGSGKTSLARVVAAGWTASDCWFVDAASVSTGEGLAAGVAAAIGLVLAEADDSERALLAFLGSRPGLLVLDNLEQVDGAGPVLERWIAAAPGIRIIATSRVPLGVPSEVPLAVSGLVLPADGTPSAVEASPAGALFLTRAHASGAALDLDPEAAGALADVLRRLDGLPLAIELAAGRSRVLTPQALLRHLADPAVVADDLGLHEERHASLDQVLSLTLATVPEAARRLLELVAVCPATFGFELARQLMPEEPVVQAIDVLVSAGLAKREGQVAGESRFRVLETIRTRIERELGSADGAAARARHALAVAAIAAAIEARWSTDEAAAAAACSAEDPNIAAAVEWSVEGDPRLGLRILAAVDRHVQSGVNMGRWVVAYRRLLAQVGPDAPERPFAVGALMRLVAQYSGPVDAITLVPEVLATAGSLGRRERRAAFLRLANVYYAVGDLATSAHYGRLAADAADDPDDADAIRVGFGADAQWLADGDSRLAAERIGRAAEAHIRAGSPANGGIWRFQQALYELRAGSVQAGVRHAREAARLCPAGYLRAWALDVLAFGLASLGDVRAARAALAEAWRHVELDARVSRIHVLDSVVAVLAAAGETAAAITALTVADRALSRTGWRRDTHVQALLDGVAESLRRAATPEILAMAESRADGLTVEAAMTAAMTRLEARSTVRRPRLADLTRRELDVLSLVGEGRSDGEIGARLGISPKTAAVHVSNLKGKLGVGSRLEAALKARELGVVADLGDQAF